MGEIVGDVPVTPPPTGLKPQWLHIEHRITDIWEAMDKHIHAMYPIPVEWIQEYNELVEKYKQIKKEGKQ